AHFNDFYPMLPNQQQGSELSAHLAATDDEYVHPHVVSPEGHVSKAVSRFAEAVKTAICSRSPSWNVVPSVGRNVLPPRLMAVIWTSPGTVTSLTVRPTKRKGTSVSTRSTSPL